MLKPVRHTACHLVFGFLGSGKTSLINTCIHQQLPTDWAVLVNEIGQIGIDGSLIDNQDALGGVMVRQISGGCICCTSQLPLQIAIVRLLSDYHPSRLWVEPTGLAHPKALLDELMAPHWQAALSIKSIIGVVNAIQWQQPRYRTHDHYIAHIRHADIVVVNRTQELSDNDKGELSSWLHQHNPSAQIILTEESGWLDRLLASWDQPTKQLSGISGAINLTTTVVPINENDDENVAILPYYYHSTQAGVSVMGWRLPAEWQVAIDELTDWLVALDNWQRIKGIVCTEEGWQALNFTPDSLALASKDGGVDNCLELIFSVVCDEQYAKRLNEQLMALFGQ